MVAPVQLNEASAAGSDTTVAVAQGSNPTVGNTNIVWVRGPSGATVTGVADTLGHTYTARGNVTEAGTGQVLYQYTAPITSSGANTVTATYGGSTANRGIAVLECDGTYDASNTGTDTGNNPTGSVSATNTAQPATVYMLCNDVQGGTPTAGSGYTSAGTGWATVGLNFRAQYKGVTSVGSQSGDFGNAGFDRNNTGLVILVDGVAGPTIDTQPANAVARDGDVAAFTVAATTSGGSLSYQWQDTSSGAFADISGATSATYVTPPVSSAWNGRLYRCAVTDSNGTVYTNGSAALIAFASEKAAPRRTPARTTHDWSAAGWFSPAMEALHLWDADLVSQPAAGGSTAPVGRADEVDAALPLGSARPAGIGAEADAALALLPVAVRAAGQADEVDLAAALVGVQLRGAGLSAETDAALGLAGVGVRPAGMATEVDTPLALAGTQLRGAGLASEADAALALAVARPAGLASEGDSAVALAGVALRTTGLAVEADAALGLAAGASGGVGLASEADTALAPSGVQLRGAGLAVEVDTAVGVAGLHLRTAGAALELDAALAVPGGQLLPAGLAMEGDAALPLSALSARAVGRADEGDAALALASPSPPAETIQLASTICPAVALLGRIARQVDAASAIVRQLAASSPIATAAAIESPVTTTVELQSTLEHETS